MLANWGSPRAGVQDMNAGAINYDLWNWYRKRDKDSAELAFPFESGLSYTKF